jgi:plasmid stabilization system protein ParE
MREGRGETFLTELRATMARVAGFPRLYPDVEFDVRQVALKKSSYNVLYRVLDGRIEVFGVVHNRSNPDSWRSRF